MHQQSHRVFRGYHFAWHGIPGQGSRFTAGSPQNYEFAVYRFGVRRSLVRLGRKRPSSMAQGWEAVLLDPVACFLGISASGLLPERAPYLMVHPVERVLGRVIQFSPLTALALAARK